MSYVRSNFDSLFKSNVREYSNEEVAKMTVSEFDALPLADQISVYNRFPGEYDRLTGRTKITVPGTEDTRSDAERFADEFEERVDNALRRAFHPNEGQK